MFNLPSKLYREHIPPEFNRKTLKCLVASCKQAKEHCNKYFPRPEARDLRGHYCRAIFEAEWRKVAAKTNGLTGSAQLNSRGTYYHTRIQCGTVILTSSQVPHPHSLVRRAEFRQGYARDTQLWLWSGDDVPDATPPNDDDPVYAILLYGLDGKRESPAFAHVVFPDNTCSRYVDRIDLMEENSALMTRLIDRAADGMDEPAVEPTIRQRPRKKNA